jgi:hypothetical protein
MKIAGALCILLLPAISVCLDARDCRRSSCLEGRASRHRSFLEGRADSDHTVQAGLPD